MALPKWLEDQVNKAKDNPQAIPSRMGHPSRWGSNWANAHPDWQENLVWTDIDAVFDQYEGIDSLFDDIAEIKRRVMKTNATGVRYVPVTYNRSVYRWDIRWEKTTPTRLGLLGYQDLVKKGYLRKLLR